MKISLNRAIVFTLFVVLFLGVRVSKRTTRVVNERHDVTEISIGKQAKAYCNEAILPFEINNAHCSGTHNNPDSRCLSAPILLDCVL